MTWHDFQLNEAATDRKGAAAPAGNDVNRLACRQQHIMEKLANHKHCHACYAKDKACSATREQLKNKLSRASG